MEYTFTTSEYFIQADGARILKEEIARDNAKLYKEIITTAAMIGFNIVSKHHGYGVMAVRKNKKSRSSTK